MSESSASSVCSANLSFKGHISPHLSRSSPSHRGGSLNSLRLGCPCPNLPHIDYSLTVSLLWIGPVNCWVTFSISPLSPLCRRPLSSPVHLSIAAASRWASDPALRTGARRKGHGDTKRRERRRSKSPEQQLWHSHSRSAFKGSCCSLIWQDYIQKA